MKNKTQHQLTIGLLIITVLAISCEDDSPRFCYECTYEYAYTDGTKDIGTEVTCNMTEESVDNAIGRQSSTRRVDDGRVGTMTITNCIKKQ